MKGSAGVLALALMPQLLSAHYLNIRDTVECSYSAVATDGDTCQSFSEEWSLTVAQFKALNPGVACPSLISGQSYCVVGTVSTASVTSKTAAKTAKTTSKATTTSAANEPRQSGTASNCDKYYKVVSGDTCNSIESKFGITEKEFDTWNPALNSQCTNLFLGYYYCVHVPGATKTTSAAGNGITTPTPHQTGMTSNCDKFYDVVKGDTCQKILDKYDLTLSVFYSWNPAVGKECTALWVGDYVCVHKIGYTPSKTSQGNGITTPTPYEPGMVNDCNKFYYVQSGDTCASIASKEKITAANIEKWNPKVGSECKDLYLHNYVCVGVK